MRHLIFIAVSILSFSFFSCEINTETHFNKDFSGSSSTTIDLSEMMGLLGSFAEEGEENDLDSLFMFFDGSAQDPEMTQSLDSMKLVLEEAGMENFAFDRAGEYGLTMSFDFDDYTVLNQGDTFTALMENLNLGDSMEEDSSNPFDSMSSNMHIERDGRWLIIDFMGGMNYDEFLADVQAEMDEAAKMENGDVGLTAEQSLEMGLGMMGSMYSISQTFSFDKKIKDIESTLPYTQSKKKVTLSYSISDLFDTLKEENEAVLKVKL